MSIVTATEMRVTDTLDITYLKNHEETIALCLNSLFIARNLNFSYYELCTMTPDEHLRMEQKRINTYDTSTLLTIEGQYKGCE